MRKVATLLLSVSLLVLFAGQFSSCEKYVIPDLQVSPDTLWFGAAADSQKVLVTTNVYTLLTMGTNDTWVFADPDFLEETTEVTTTEVTIYVLENETYQERSLTLPVRSEALQRNLVVIQAGKQEE